MVIPSLTELDEARSNAEMSNNEVSVPILSNWQIGDVTKTFYPASRYCRYLYLSLPEYSKVHSNTIDGDNLAVWLPIKSCAQLVQPSSVLDFTRNSGNANTINNPVQLTSAQYKSPSQ